MAAKNLRHKTAISRIELSKPFRTALAAGLIDKKTTIFDYGCGRGDDLRHLKAMGHKCNGWDPVHKTRTKTKPAHLVNLGYVSNVIEDPAERGQVLKTSWGLAQKILMVSARLELEAKGLNKTAFADGYMTGRGTFQKFYSQQELREWIDTTLNTTAVAAAPGIFFVFKDQALKQEFLAKRFRRSSAAPRPRLSDLLFDKHKELLDPFIDFLTHRGRLPIKGEFPSEAQLIKAMGSLNKAYGIIKRVTDPRKWRQIEYQGAEDLLIYLGLSRFDGRPKREALPPSIKADVRAFFGTYKKACHEADQLLFSIGDMDVLNQACQASPVGKLTPTALYIHETALADLPTELILYEGSARRYIGNVEGANIIKLNRHKPQVSYLSYPDFEKVAHPALTSSLIVPLLNFNIRHIDYSESKNPFILHRKETFIKKDHPKYKLFKRLTEKEEKAGLLDETSGIGTRDGWKGYLAKSLHKIKGHKLQHIS